MAFPRKLGGLNRGLTTNTGKGANPRCPYALGLAEIKVTGFKHVATLAVHVFVNCEIKLNIYVLL